jgi:hypothetical protein
MDASAPADASEMNKHDIPFLLSLLWLAGILRRNCLDVGLAMRSS